MRNIDITALDTMLPSELGELPAGVFADLQDEVDALLEAAKRGRAALDSALDFRYGKVANGARKHRGIDSGIVRLWDDGCEIEAETKKDVKWDQEKLRTLRELISSAGDDPSLYLVTKTTFTVREAAYKEWPAHIREAFEPARTVKISRQTYRIRRAGQERSAV